MRRCAERERTEALKKGYDIVRGIAASLEEKQRAAELAKDVRAFSLARKLFELIRNSPEAATLAPGAKLKLIQRHALCTYRDDDLVADERFGDALGILNEGDLQTANPSQETLGQAGAIYKTKWRLGGQRRDLERALHYYKRGTESVLEGDFGYTRINAAFVLDLLAKQEEADSPSTASPRREQAARLREEIAAELPGLAARPENGWLKEEWWYGATMAEALFGLKRYAEARHWFREAIALDPPAWQLETTTRQMAMLAFAQGVNFGENEEATQTLAMLVGDSSEALRAITAGKVGLALSGGGFRASLFHIGVLAPALRNWTCCGMSRCSRASRVAPLSGRTTTWKCVAFAGEARSRDCSRGLHRNRQTAGAGFPCGCSNESAGAALRGLAGELEDTFGRRLHAHEIPGRNAREAYLFARAGWRTRHAAVEFSAVSRLKMGDRTSIRNWITGAAQRRRRSL